MKVPTKIRDQVLHRDCNCCARCGRSVINYPSSIHHRVPRGMGGTKDPRSASVMNLVLLCGTGTTGCHAEIESHRSEAYETRWLLRSYGDLDLPIVRPDGARIRLFREGGRITWHDSDLEYEAT